MPASLNAILQNTLILLTKTQLIYFRVCDKLETIYSLGIFSQFILTIISICVSTTCLTIDRSQIFALASYLILHTLQMFMYCFMGNELMNESQSVADAAFECGWHLKYDKNVRFYLRMIIMRAEKKQCLTALGFTYMDFRSFVKVHVLISDIIDNVINCAYLSGVKNIIFFLYFASFRNVEVIQL